MHNDSFPTTEVCSQYILSWPAKKSMHPLVEVCFATCPRDKKRLAPAISLAGQYRFAQPGRAEPPDASERSSQKGLSPNALARNAPFLVTSDMGGSSSRKMGSVEVQTAQGMKFLRE